MLLCQLRSVAQYLNFSLINHQNQLSMRAFAEIFARKHKTNLNSLQWKNI